MTKTLIEWEEIILPFFMERWKNTISDIVFSDFIVSTEFNIPNDVIRKEVEELEKEYPSPLRTNIGGSQTSPIDTSSPLIGDITKKYPALSDLNDFIMEFSTLTIQSNGICTAMDTVRRSNWWVNRNPIHGYNCIHEHGRTDLIGIYYVKSTPESGTLTVVRNDGSSYTKLYKGNSDDFKRSFTVPCIEGKFFLFPGHLWHYVTEHLGGEDRISISYNLYL